MEVAKKVVLDLLSQEDLEGKTFKIMTRRSDHTFEMDTNQINLFLGDAVLEAFPDIKVQLKQPDITVRIDVRREHFNGESEDNPRSRRTSCWNKWSCDADAIWWD